ncbi:MAG TPA: hypothetical protein VHU40_19335 [Polyangia bacterium]|nr:hypothetical protein [Polyangia bacterium]
MPVRTSSVVAVGLIGLTALGVVTIFGSSLLALSAPPEAPRIPAPPAEPSPSPAPAGPAGTSDGGVAPAAAPTEKPSPKDGP